MPNVTRSKEEGRSGHTNSRRGFWTLEKDLLDKKQKDGGRAQRLHTRQLNGAGKKTHAGTTRVNTRRHRFFAKKWEKPSKRCANKGDRTVRAAKENKSRWGVGPLKPATTDPKGVPRTGGRGEGTRKGMPGIMWDALSVDHEQHEWHRR